MNALYLLEEEIFSCEKCPELALSRMYPMPGFHGKNIKLAVVGINPGPWNSNDVRILKQYNMDYRKTYEYGIKECSIGRFMEKVLSCMGLTWDNIFFTNIVKCSTPHVRLPTPQEIDTCLSFLRRQLKIIKPKNILLLGKFTIQSLKLDLDILATSEIKNTQIITLYHPSYIKRTGTENKVLDFLKTIKLKE